MLSCNVPCAADSPCYCRRINAARAGRPTDYREQRIDTSPLPEAMAPGRMLAQIKARRARRGVLSLTPGTPEHAARVAARGQTDAERDGL